MLCCFVCGDSRESMDPSDQYPDMGTWGTVEDCPVWTCDVCVAEVWEYMYEEAKVARKLGECTEVQA